MDFTDLFRQLELVPEEVVEIGLAGEEILQLDKAQDSIGAEFRRLFWPNFEASSPEQKLLLPPLARSSPLPSPEQMDVLFRSATFGMVTADSDDRILDSNKSFRRLFTKEGEMLPSLTFSSLIIGKGAEAERRARKAVLTGKTPNYRILLHLRGAQGTVRVWVSAVLFRREGQADLLLRSVQRDQLIDDLVSMQEQERKILLNEISQDVLGPVLELWNILAPGSALDLKTRQHCLAISEHLASELRESIKNLRNPILQGVALSQAWPEKKLDPSLDKASETSALLVYRVVSECRRHFGSDIAGLELASQGDWLRGKLSAVGPLESERFALLNNLCHLVGGRMAYNASGPRGGFLEFEIPAVTH